MTQTPARRRRRDRLVIARALVLALAGGAVSVAPLVVAAAVPRGDERAHEAEDRQTTLRQMIATKHSDSGTSGTSSSPERVSKTLCDAA